MPTRSNAWLVIWAAGATLVCLAFVDRSCRGDRLVREAKAAYETLVAQTDAANAVSQEKIAALLVANAKSDAKILKLEEAVTQKDARITLLVAELAAIVGQEPPTTPEVEALPIVINLRAQVRTLNEMFALSEAKSADKDDIIGEWEAKFNTQFKITMEWKDSYDREHALRVKCEDLFKLSEQARKSNKTIKNIALAVAGAGVAYGLLK